MTLVLASASATRRGLLERAGVAFTTDPARVDERAMEAPLLAAGAEPATIARHLAAEKALEVSRRRPGDTVIGADQVLACGAERFTKPEDRAAARRQLLALRGREHALHSAVALARDGGVVWQDLATARLRMRAFSEAFLDDYLATAGEAVLGSVGAYQLEGPGIQLFEAVEGDYFTILGLPLLVLLPALRDRGLLLA